MTTKKTRQKEETVKLTVRLPKSTYEAMGHYIEKNPHLSLNALTVISIEKNLGEISEK